MWRRRGEGTHVHKCIYIDREREREREREMYVLTGINKWLTPF